MLTSFPTTIPLPSKVSFSNAENRTLSSAGTQNAKARGAKSVTRYNLTFDLSNVQAGLFDTYYNSVLKGGQDYFLMRLPGVGGIIQRKVKFVSGLLRERNINVGFIYSSDLETA